MKDMGLMPGMAMDREKWSCGIVGRTSDPHKRGNTGRQTSSSNSISRRRVSLTVVDSEVGDGESEDARLVDLPVRPWW